MYIDKLLYELHNNSLIVYLDSSSLIRNYPINVLSKNVTRGKYISNPQKFSIILNRLTIPLLDTSTILYNIFDKTTNHFSNFNIITYDCMFPATHNKRISTLFGSLNFKENVISINASTILYGDIINIETFFNAATLIHSANLIIIDDYFLSLSIGTKLFERKKENSSIITLSSIIGYQSYNTKEVIDIFSCLFSNYLLL